MRWHQGRLISMGKICLEAAKACLGLPVAMGSTGPTQAAGLMPAAQGSRK